MKLNAICVLSDYTNKTIKLINYTTGNIEKFVDITEIFLFFEVELLSQFEVLQINIFKNDIEIVIR